MLLIQLRETPTGWQASFTGGDMPQGMWLSLPYSVKVSPQRCQTILLERYPHAWINFGPLA
jgi:hypothetical protein